MTLTLAIGLGVLVWLGVIGAWVAPTPAPTDDLESIIEETLTVCATEATIEQCEAAMGLPAGLGVATGVESFRRVGQRTGGFQRFEVEESCRSDFRASLRGTAVHTRASVQVTAVFHKLGESWMLTRLTTDPTVRVDCRDQRT